MSQNNGGFKEEVSFISRGGGRINFEEDRSNINENRFDIQVNGTKWWVISVAGLAERWHCKNTNGIDPFWYPASWFDWIQPQLCLTR